MKPDMEKRIQVSSGVKKSEDCMGFPRGSVVKNPPAMQETRVWSLGQEDALEEEIATHSSILTWEMPRTEKPGGLQSMGLYRVQQPALSCSKICIV